MVNFLIVSWSIRNAICTIPVWTVVFLDLRSWTVGTTLDVLDIVAVIVFVFIYFARCWLDDLLPFFSILHSRPI